MRVVSWIAGIVVAIAVVTGTGSVIRAQTLSSRHALTAATPPVAAVTYLDASGLAPRWNPRNAPEPTTVVPAAVAPAPAPVAAKPAAAAPHYPQPARPSIVIGSTQQVLINRERAAHGLAPLTWSTCLYSIARSNAIRMAGQGYISHTNGASLDLGCGLGHQAGENIGWWSGGINDTQINTMFMNSPEHRANILGPYHYVATSWVVAANGYAYIAVEFG